jgi:hypothetical protein
MKMSLSISASFVLPLMLTSLIDAQGINASSQAFTSSSSTVSTVKETTLPKRKLISQTTSSRTYYVSGSGSDRNNGLSPSSAFRTLQKAANLAKPGVTVLVMNGVYTNAHAQGEALLIEKSGTPNAWIKFKAYPGHSPKIKHNGWNGILINNGAAYIEIYGLEIEGNNRNITLDYAKSQKYNSYNPLTNGNCIVIDGRKGGHPHHIRIVNNKVHNCGGYGIASMRADYVTIDGNEVYNNAWYSVHANSGISMYQNINTDNNTGYKMYVTNNKVYNNRQYIPWIRNGKITDGNGIIIDDTQHTQNGSTSRAYKGRTLIANNITYLNGGSGIGSHRSEHMDIINNTAYLNNQSPEINYGQIFPNYSSNIKVLNNILYAYPGKKVNAKPSGTNVVYDYNVYANSTVIGAKGSNNIVADPQFVNPSIGDFRIKHNSPAINSGFKFMDNDFVKNPRPSGKASDIGAYEYQF